MQRVPNAVSLPVSNAPLADSFCNLPFYITLFVFVRPADINCWSSHLSPKVVRTDWYPSFIRENNGHDMGFIPGMQSSSLCNDWIFIEKQL